jgi:hypothetical protein
MKFLDNLSRRLNPQQKIIFAIVVPIILIVITIPIASEMDGSLNAFDFKDTFLAWAICFAIIGYFEYKLFGNTENK